MQCSSKVEDDPTGQQHHHQPDDDPLPPHRSQEIPVKNCEGGGEGKGIESVGEKTKVSGHYSAPPSADSTRSYTDKIQTDNNNDVEKKITNSDNENLQNLKTNNSYEFANIISNNEKVGAGTTESSPVTESHQSGQAGGVGPPEVSQNISSSDQFINLNGRVQQQNIDHQFNNHHQFDHQQHQQQQQSYHNQFVVHHQQQQRGRPVQLYNQHPAANFLFQQQQQQQQVSGPGPGGHRGFQQNFPSQSFYSGHSQPQQHPSYNVQNGPSLPQTNFNSNCFPVNFPPHPGPVVARQNNLPYEDASEDLDTSNNVTGAGPGPGHTQPGHCHQFSLRARRRVRQRVDAGEPRNSYSSIPGFSFRHQNMMSRHGHFGSGGDDYTISGLYRGGGGGGLFSGMRGRGGGRHHGPLHPLPPYNTGHLPGSLTPGSRVHHRQPGVQHPPPFPLAAAAVVHRAAMFLGSQGGLAGSGCGQSRGAGTVALPAVSGDDTKTVQSLLRDETSEKLDVLPTLISTPPTTPPAPLVDSENSTVKKISSSDCNSDPIHAISAASDNNNKNQQQHNSQTITNNNKTQEYFSKNALLIRELLSSKLAAVTDMMEQGFGLVAAHNGPRDFSQHSLPINNNELKENHAAQIMSFLKARQEMALNMSKDSDSDRHTESPGHISDNDITEEEKDEPINLHQNGRSSVAGSGSDGEASPASPSSDAGNSTSSNKEQKASRLENIVGGLARSTSSPLPPQGCKKRKLYQPVQHDVADEEMKEKVEKQEEPEQKKLKDGMIDQNHIKSMQEQFQKVMQEKFYNNHNDENADPEDSELQIDLSQEDKKFHKEEITIEKRLNLKPFASMGGHPLLNGATEPLPIPPSPMNPNYMDLAKKFLQEKQDQLTKEMITRDIVDSTIGKNEIAEKLKAISPELEGLADILKSELKTSLTIIVDSIVQRYLTQKRQPLSKFSENSLFNQETKSKTPSGRAPQVRDRSTPRTIQNPVSMANPSTLSLNTSVASHNNLVMTGAVAPPRISFPTSVSGDLALPKPPPMISMYPSLNGQISDDEKDDEFEQDDALNLTVTPKKKRHKVTDTRITPRTVSRLLGDQPNIADLHKHFGPGANPFMAPGFLPRPPFPGLPGSFLPNIPTSLNPSLSHPADHFPFSPFGFPGPLNRPRDLSPPSRPRSASPPRDTRPPPPLIHPAILAAQSPDFSHRIHHNDDNRPSSEAGSDDLKMEFGNSPFSLGNMSGKF